MSSLSEQVARYGDTGLVECIVEGLPRPTSISWKKDGKELDVSNLRRLLLLSSCSLVFQIYFILQFSSYLMGNCNNILMQQLIWIVFF